MLKQNLVVYCDGGARGNPGPAAVGVVIFNGEGNLRDKCGKYIGKTTNNVAEYEGVVTAFGIILDLKDINPKKTDLTFNLDSSLVVNQLNGLYKIKKGHLRDLLFKIRHFEQNFPKVSYNLIPREKNTEADFLVNQALDNYERTS